MRLGLLTLLVLCTGVAYADSATEAGPVAPKPLYRDPVYDGAADPVLVWNRQEGKWWMFYTNRRANAAGLRGVEWVHGTRIGIAESGDGGATWKYRGTADLPIGGEQDTHWAPDIVFNDGTYHMFLTFVPGIHEDWSGQRRIVHLTSPDLVTWKNAGQLPFASDRVLDASVLQVADGTWRMWYNDEKAGKTIFLAESPDLMTWTDKGRAVADRGEGPKAFRWHDSYWLIVDRWEDGLAVYRSDDAKDWTRQPEALLIAPGKGEDDKVHGGHADVVVSGGRAFLFYFTHPGRRPGAPRTDTEQRRSSIQVVELKYQDGRLTCDRDEPTHIRLTGPGWAVLPRSTPEAQGVSSSAIQSFAEAADRDIDSLHSFMFLRHGHVIAEGWWSPYSAESPHMLYSLSKSFTSTAVGLAIAEGKLSLDDEVLKFFPEDAPSNPSNNLREMRVSDLLRMSTGQQSEPPRPMDQVWTKAFLAHPVPFKPGTHFLYNTSGTYMLSAIVQKATGQTVLDYLKPRLFEPLGIENPTWETSPQGISCGGYGLSIRTEDIARFGQLYLQKGNWQGKQLVPAAWIEAATSRQTSNGSNPNSDWDQGYGYQFWRCRHGLYRGDGAFGQYCIVMPDQDAVVAITSGVRDMQAVMNLVWDKLLPAMESAALPADDAAVKKLQQTLKGLSLRTPQGSAAPAKAWDKTYRFPANDRKLEFVSLEQGSPDGSVTLLARIDGEEQRIVCGDGSWIKGRIVWAPLQDVAVAASGVWTGVDTFTAKLCFYETPYVTTIRLKFSDRELQWNSESNVSFGPTKDPQLTGRAE